MATETSIDLKALVDTYVKLRDKRAEKKKEFDAVLAKYDEGLEKLESVLLGQLMKNNADSMSTAAGTFFKVAKISCTVADKDAFLGWVKLDLEHRLDYVDARAAKTNIVAFKKEREAALEEARKIDPAATLDILPPGIGWSEMTGLNVRRS
jgi:hypothetical protein